MAKSPKSPQEKKELALKKDHVTLGGESVHGFRKIWPKKKALANREYRRKSDELLAKPKSGNSAEDVEYMTGDVTATELEKSISRKRLVKWGAISLESAIQYKFEKREETVGRRANRNRRADAHVSSALSTLESLSEPRLKSFLTRLDALLERNDFSTQYQLSQSPDPQNQALFFVHQVVRKDFTYCRSLQRNREFCLRYHAWRRKAVQVMEKMMRPAKRKFEEKAANEKKVKAQLRKSSKQL